MRTWTRSTIYREILLRCVVKSEVFRHCIPCPVTNSCILEREGVSKYAEFEHEVLLSFPMSVAVKKFRNVEKCYNNP